MALIRSLNTAVAGLKAQQEELLAAILQAKSVASNLVIGPTPLCPASRASQVLDLSRPSGVKSPMPVMTTRLFMRLPVPCRSDQHDGKKETAPITGPPMKLRLPAVRRRERSVKLRPWQRESRCRTRHAGPRPAFRRPRR